ncbi:L-ascorbate oxidase [Triticum urartu]|uniref:L-ascorbate oxidase n=1 Tax=Triticum urartu TaxID=4572 RepID=M7ZUA2_TRIUA|nr:L-ascorbate oxidase [Triticum urartu]
MESSLLGAKQLLLCCLFLFLWALAAVAEAKTVHEQWDISYQFTHSDCVRKLAVTINGGTPGPTIRAVQGDTVVAKTVHEQWDISYQFTHSDCVRKLAVTINGGTPGPTIRAVQGDTVVVTVKNLLMTENVAIHWHGIRQLGTPWADGTEGVTQCPILPGDTFEYRYNCSAMASDAAAACNATHPECAPQVFAVVPGRTYRFRIASVTSLSALNFEIEADKRDRGRPRPTRTPPAGPAWNDSAYRINQSLATVAHPEHAHPPPPRADRTILLLNSQNKIDGRIKWAINNVSFTLPHTPYLVALKHGLLGAFDQRPPPETYNHTGYDVYGVQANPNATTSDGLYRLAFGSVVDVVLQNANMLAPNNSETHPWHLHGHDFWTLGYGVGRFDPAVHPATYNLRDPVMKNTVAVHPFGWTALRFRADNPGVWAFHCHIEAHFFMGMGVAFEEGIERVGDLPEEIRRCVSTKGGGH